MDCRAAWSPETRDLFTAAMGRQQDRRFLVVERLPDGGWDWIAWCQERAGVSRQGVADNAATAMAAAERAATLLAPTHGIFHMRGHAHLQSARHRPN